MDFTLFVGPTKTGTTWIHEYLAERGDINLPDRTKETFYFDKVNGRGFDWYRAQFETWGNGKTAEVAPSLFHKPEACRNAVRDIAGARIIVTWRDPVDRAVSHYFHYRKAGIRRRPLAEIIARHPGIIDAGRFDLHLPRWRDAFGADRVHVVPYALMRSDPEAFCQAICEVMEIDYVPPSEALVGSRINSASVPRWHAAARFGRGGADFLRRMGLHGSVNFMKRTPLKRILFSGGADIPGERNEVHNEMKAILEPMSGKIANAVAPSIRQRVNVTAH